MGAFRLFFDPQDLENASYLSPDCGTYASKFLGSKSSTLRIDILEIFGFGGPEALQAQIVYREVRQKEINKARKVDKKFLLEDGVAKQHLFEKTFAHQAQINERGEDDEMLARNK